MFKSLNQIKDHLENVFMCKVSFSDSLYTVKVIVRFPKLRNFYFTYHIDISEIEKGNIKDINKTLVKLIESDLVYFFKRNS